MVHGSADVGRDEDGRCACWAEAGVAIVCGVRKPRHRCRRVETVACLGGGGGTPGEDGVPEQPLCRPQQLVPGSQSRNRSQLQPTAHVQIVGRRDPEEGALRGRPKRPRRDAGRRAVLHAGRRVRQPLLEHEEARAAERLGGVRARVADGSRIDEARQGEREGVRVRVDGLARAVQGAAGLRERDPCPLCSSCQHAQNPCGVVGVRGVGKDASGVKVRFQRDVRGGGPVRADVDGQHAAPQAKRDGGGPQDRGQLVAEAVAGARHARKQEAARAAAECVRGGARPRRRRTQQRRGKAEQREGRPCPPRPLEHPLREVGCSRGIPLRLLIGTRSRRSGRSMRRSVAPNGLHMHFRTRRGDHVLALGAAVAGFRGFGELRSRRPGAKPFATPLTPTRRTAPASRTPPSP
ncbi:hypothetical protein DFJ74DRAFT_688392 [Hyaloraphidium curvatum]|nr:hypothetical protein DFJ74DRAFT_688392 [Hyaloraphidium curvatum]